jgi:hypothetical protein
MTTDEANKVVANRLAHEVFSQGNMEAFDELLSDDYVDQNGLSGYRRARAGRRVRG